MLSISNTSSEPAGLHSPFNLECSVSGSRDTTIDQRIAQLCAETLVSNPTHRAFDEALAQLPYLETSASQTNLRNAIHITSFWLKRDDWQQSKLGRGIKLSAMTWMRALTALPEKEMCLYEAATAAAMTKGCSRSTEPGRSLQRILQSKELATLMQHGRFYVVAQAISDYAINSDQMRQLAEQIDPATLTAESVHSLMTLASLFTSPVCKGTVPKLLAIKLLKCADCFPQLTASAEMLWHNCDHQDITFEEYNLLCTARSKLATQWLQPKSLISDNASK